MIAAAVAFILANLPMLAAFTGPAGVVAGIAAKFMPNARTWLIGGAIVLGVIAVAGCAVHYMKLVDAADNWHAIEPKIAALEQGYGCPALPPEERDLFACIPARDRDVAEAQRAALQKQQETSARAQNELQKKHDQLAADLAESDRMIDAAIDADDGPLPKVVLDNWARQRKGGAK